MIPDKPNSVTLAAAGEEVLVVNEKDDDNDACFDMKNDDIGIRCDCCDCEMDLEFNNAGGEDNSKGEGSVAVEFDAIRDFEGWINACSGVDIGSGLDIAFGDSRSSIP